MARVCCVEGCDALTRDDVTYFPFPISLGLRRKWREAVQAPKLTVDAMICSQHFTTSDYVTVRGKIRLKAKVVPSLFGQDVKEKSQKSPQPPENISSKATNGNTNDNSIQESNNTDNIQLNNHTGDNQDVHKQTDKSDPMSQETCNNDKMDQETSNNDTMDQETSNNDKMDQETSNNDTMDQEVSNNDTMDQETSNNDTMDQEVDNNEEEYLNIEPLVEIGLGRESMDEGSIDENGLVKCTIECVPEAILTQEEDETNSETELHKGDIEDIIANYHIKQDKKLAERLKAAQEKEAKNQEKDKQASQQGSRQDSSKTSLDKRTSENITLDDDEEVEFIPTEQQAPVFIELPVDQDMNNTADGNNEDCLIVLEKVQVDIDPAALFPPEPGDENEDTDDDVQVIPNKKEDPISLLTSSDEDEVIIEEPHVDTVEVSDETDEDDVPLVRLVQPLKKPSVSSILWGGRYEFFCCVCHFKTTNRKDYCLHKIEHEKVIHVCEVCSFQTPSQYQFLRHKKKHRDEKRFKCHLCDYKAKHKMSLIYHLKSHEGVTAKTLDCVNSGAKDKNKNLSCSKCKFKTTSKVEMWKHFKCCAGVKMYSCDQCSYASKKRSDLKWHRIRRHEADSEEEYVPPPYVNK